MRHRLFMGATKACVSSYFQLQTLMSHLHVFLTGSRGHCNTSSLRSAAVALSTSQRHVSQVCLSAVVYRFLCHYGGMDLLYAPHFAKYPAVMLQNKQLG